MRRRVGIKDERLIFHIANGQGFTGGFGVIIRQHDAELVAPEHADIQAIAGGSWRDANVSHVDILIQQSGELLL
jgi:hypothetical protein